MSLSGIVLFPLLFGVTVAVGDDMNEQGRHGGLWGLFTFFSGGLVALLWLADRRVGRNRPAPAGGAS